MADLHIDSVGGSTTSPFETWAKAATTLAGVTGAAAGDRYLLNKLHAESVATVSVALPGTVANPVQMLSGTKDTTSGLTDLTAGAQITYTGTSFNLTGLCAYISGLKVIGSSASSHDQNYFTSVDNNVEMENCHSELSGAGASSAITFGAAGAGGGGRVVLRNHTFKLGQSGQRIKLLSEVRIHGASFASGTTTPTAIFALGSGTRGNGLVIEGLDCTNLGNAFDFAVAAQGGTRVVIRDATVPSGWTGAPMPSAATRMGFEVECYGITKGGTHLRVWNRSATHDLQDSGSVYLDGGASDSAPYSLYMTTTANVSYPAGAARSIELQAAPITSTGSPITWTVEILRQSGAASITDAQVWLEAELPDGQVISTRAGALTTPANLTSSSAAWTGGSSPTKQKVSVTGTPASQGRPILRLYCAIPSTTLYFNPKATV